MFRRILALLTLFLAPALLAQTTAPCALPPIQVRSAPGNFFTEAQENQLGDVIAEQWQQRLTIIHDDPLADRLRTIGQRLVAQLPTTMQYHFELIDLSEPNAFSLPGGRIFVSRKLIALMQSDDELAAVLAHELGHEVTHQGAAFVSRWLRLTGVNSVTTADDIRQRYNQLLDTQATRKIKPPKEEDEQVDADAVAIQAMIHAGYNPQAFATMFHRLTLATGKTNFFADLFGRTNPDDARLKQVQKVVAAIPTPCRPSRPEMPETFLAWQQKVLAYNAATVTASAAMPGLLWQRKLSPTLRPDVNTIRFSYDGKYLLVQDSGQIDIVTRQPFASYFRIPAQDAQPAQFSGDSSTVSFYIGQTSPRIETWSLADKKLLAVHELHTPHGCSQSALAPDGKFFACLKETEGGVGEQFDLLVYDTNTGAEVLRKNDMMEAYGYQLFYLEMQLLLDRYFNRKNLPFIYLDFSPDGRYLIGARGNRIAAFDLQQRTPLNLPSTVKNNIGNGFAFLSANRIIFHKSDNRTAEVHSFPDGQLVKGNLVTGGAALHRSGSPDFVLLTPIKDFPIGLLDINQNKIVVGWKSPALDSSGSEYAVELKDGELACARLEANPTVSLVKLDDSNFGEAHLALASNDLHWLAISDHTRGAIWNLETGERVYHLLGFDGASFDRYNYFHGDMPKHDKVDRVIAHINLANPDLKSVRGTPETPADDTTVVQSGRELLNFKEDKNRHYKTDGFCRGESLFDIDWTARSMGELDVQEAVNQNRIWSKTFPQHIDSYFVRAASDSLAFARCNKDVVQLEFHQLSTGADIATLSVPTNKGSIGVTTAFASGDYLIVGDDEHRVAIYGKDGHPIGRIFGTHATAAGTLLAVDAEARQLSLYELANAQKYASLDFPQPILYDQFDEAGKRLLVVTADQSVYLFDTAATKLPATKVAANEAAR